jgi:membrane protein YqaA with SNARE-associated domain
MNIKSWIEKLFTWVEKYARSKYKMHALFWVAFFEQSFSIIMPDILIIPIAMYKKYSALYVATFGAIASLLGGITTYIIAAYFGDRVLAYFDINNFLESTKIAYSQNVFWAMLVASFTPIPDKIFTIFGGIFKVAFLPFAAALFIGKFARYIIVAYIAENYGEKARDLILEKMNKIFIYLSIFILLLICVYYFVLR